MALNGSMRATKSLLSIVLLLAPFAGAQQSPAPQPAPAQTKAAPCGTQATPQMPKGWHFKIPAQMQKLYDQQRQKIANATGVTAPTSDEMQKQAEQQVTPCPAAPAVKPAPSPVPVTPTAPPTTIPKPTTGGSAALPRSFPMEGAFVSPRYENVLDTPVVSFSAVDHLTFRPFCEGTLITGAPGSGKSSCSGRQLAMGLLRVPNMGGLILTAKAEETQNWLRYAKECGREQDVIVFNAEGPHCFDLLHYEWTKPGRGSADLEGIIDLFSSLLSNGKKESSHGDGLFFERATEQLMRNVIVLLDLSGEPVSIVSIDRVIKSLPTRPGEYEIETWQKDAYCAQLIGKVRDRQSTLTEEQWSDLDMASHYMFIAWPNLDERPRTSIAMTWSGMADRFLFSPYNRLFCSGKCTFTPEMTTHEGKIMICDFPLLQCGHETGATVNKLIKLSFQRAWLRRDLSESPNPVFLWQDEFQYFITRKDNFFQQTCRGSRVAVVCLTQNILNLSEELGETQPGSKTKSFLGNLGIKIFHQQNDTETCSYAADQIGKEYRYIDNYSGGGSSDSQHTHFSSGGSRQLVHIVEPVEFTRLAKPDSSSPLAQAIVYQSGKVFNASKTERNPKGSNYLSVFFSRA